MIKQHQWKVIATCLVGLLCVFLLGATIYEIITQDEKSIECAVDKEFG